VCRGFKPAKNKIVVISPRILVSTTSSKQLSRKRLSLALHTFPP
jgi:hypothetical protein